MAGANKYSSTVRKFTPFSAGLNDHNLGLVKNAVLMEFKDDNLQEQSYFTARPSITDNLYINDSTSTNIGQYISANDLYIATNRNLWTWTIAGSSAAPVFSGTNQSFWQSNIGLTRKPIILFDNTTTSVTTPLVVTDDTGMGQNNLFYTTPSEGNYQLPFLANPYGVCMDGFLFLAEQGSDTIYNTDLNDFMTWDTAVNLINASQFPGNIVALSRINNYVVALKENSIEFFYNAGLSETSPLERNQSYTRQVGLANAATLVTTPTSLVFIGKDIYGARKVFELSETKLDTISTTKVEEYINTFTTNSVSLELNAFFMSIGGKQFYVLQNTPSKLSLVYDFSKKVWYEWYVDTEDQFLPFYCRNTVGSTYSPLWESGVTCLGPMKESLLKTGVYFISFNTPYHRLKDYLLSSPTSEENYVEFTITLQLPPTDFGESNRKFVRELSVSGYFPPDTEATIFKQLILTKYTGGLHRSTPIVKQTTRSENLNFKNWGSSNLFKVGMLVWQDANGSDAGARAQDLRIYGINYEITMGSS